MASNQISMGGRVRAAGIAVATVLLSLVPVITAPGAQASPTRLQTFTAIGAEQTYTVPTGVTSIHMTAIGGSGGAGANLIGGPPNAPGGPGADVGADLAVTPGQIFYIEVGSNANNGTAQQCCTTGGGFNGGGQSDRATGGGGGGASDVRTVSSGSGGTLASRLLVAGGGGGGGGGGYDDSCGSKVTAGSGGAGSGTTGANGGNGNNMPCYARPGGGGGGGGTPSAGGAGGTAGGTGSPCNGASPGGAGSSGVGGNGGFEPNFTGGRIGASGGGGGGGGYFGGGGGGGGMTCGAQASSGGGGGGAGSSYADPTTAAATFAVDGTGTPQVIIGAITSTTTAVNCAPAPTVVNQAVSCTATVTDTDATPVTPTGTVTFATSGGGGFSSTTCALSGGACSVNYTPNAVTTDTVTATYAGDIYHTGSNGNTGVTANQRTTSVAVGCVPTSPAVNAPTTCTATAADTSGGTAMTRTGTVNWTVTAGSGTFTPAASCSLSSSACSVTYTPAPTSLGTNTVQAAYGGDTNHTGSTGSTSVTATKRSTTTAAACVPSSGTVNSSSTCTATVTDTSAGTAITPTGTVTWSIVSGTGTYNTTTCPLSAGSCSVTYTPTASGSNNLLASYGGDSTHNTSSGNAGVSGGLRSTSLGASCVPSSDPVNAATTCTATATDTSAGTAVTPTGTVTWSITTGSGSLSGTTCSLSSGSCSVTYTPNLSSEGAHTLHAAYPGDANHTGSSGNAGVTAVTRTTSMTAGCSSPSGPVNSAVSCVASVADTSPGTAATPTGTVSWSLTSGSGTFSGAPCTLTFGFCFVSYTPAAGSEGVHTLNAVYSGDVDHSTSSGSRAYTATVRATSVAASCAPNSLVVNSPTTCTATVSDSDTGTTSAPSGTVAWTVGPGSGAFSPTSCVLSSSTCSVTYTPAPGSEGTQTLHAAYGGDTDHGTSVANTSVTATMRSESMSAGCVPISDAVNAPSTCTATVTDTDTGTALVPSGSVQWTITTGTGTFSASGLCTLSAGSCSVTYTPALGSEGSQTLLASYSGDADFPSDSASTGVTATKRATSTGAGCAPTSQAVNATTTCTATVTDTSAGTTATPSGTVAWTVTTGSGNFSSPSCTLSSGSCSVTYTPSFGSAGSQTLHAAYSGATDDAVSSGNAAFTATTRSTSITNPCTQSTGHITISVTCIASVSDTSPGSGAAPSGTVSWSLASGMGSFSSSTCSLSGGVCTITYTPAIGSVGPQSIQAHYNGDVDHAVSSSAFAYTVTDVPVTVTVFGVIHAADGVVLNTTGEPNWGTFNIARGVVVVPKETGGYTLDGYGGVHAWGTGGLVSSATIFGTFDIARAIALNPCDATGHSGYVLDGYGGLHAFGGAPALTGNDSWPGNDKAKALAMNPCGPGGKVTGYVLDAFGFLHGFSSGAAIPNPPSTTWGTFNIARGIVVSANGQGYTLDGYGGLHTFGGAPTLTPSVYWGNFDIARGLVLQPGGGGGWVLDGYGGLHQFGTAPSEAGGGYTSGSDIHRSPAFG